MARVNAAPIVVYDLDGTLAWTEKYWIPVMARVLEHIDAEYQWQSAVQDPRELLRWLGHPAQVIMRAIYPQASSEAIDHVLEVKAELWGQLLQEYPFELYPGTLDALKEVQAMGVRQFVASNCDEVYLERMLTTTGLGPFIEDAACLGMYPGIEKKEFTRRLLAGVQHEDGVFVGDSFHDMEAGRHNQLRTVFADYGYGQSSPELIDRRLSEIRELPGVLGALFG